MAHMIRVTASEQGQKLINFLVRRLAEDVPHSALMRWIRTGQVRVDKGRAKPFMRLEEGAEVRIPPQAVLRDVDENRPATPLRKLPDIVHSDEHLLVLNKPSGLPVHGGSRVEDSLAACLENQYGHFAFTPTLAHRLDKDTSGLILAAHSYEALNILNYMFSRHQVVKIYLAWVAGRWKGAGLDVMRDRLEKKVSGGFERVETGSGKPAETRLIPLLREESRSLVALRLITGRTHQLRAQLAARGHPILGDGKYQGPESRRLRLHAWRILLPETRLWKEMSFLAHPDWSGGVSLSLPLPEIWWRLLEEGG